MRNAFSELRRTEDPDALATAVRIHIRHRSPAVRQTCLDHIRCKRMESMSELAAELLHDANALVRCAAVQAVAAVSGREASAQLCEVLATDRSALVRGYCANELAEIGDEQVLLALVDSLNRERSAWTRAALHIALYRWQPEAHLSGILRGLRSLQYRVRTMVANCMPEPMRETDRAAMLAALASALDVEDSVAAGEAEIRSILALGGRDAAAVVERELIDGEVLGIRIVAVRALAGLLKPTRLRALVRSACRNEPDPAARRLLQGAASCPRPNGTNGDATL